MNKIIAALDGVKYSLSAANYATRIAKATGSHVVGIFLDDLAYEGLRVYDFLGHEVMAVEKTDIVNKQHIHLREETAFKFKAACIKEGLSFSIHHHNNSALEKLLHECIYADLLIIDKKETFRNSTEEIPTHFMRNLLSDVKCPVMVVPGKYKPIEKAILLYDGHASSVHAIKMYSYILSSLNISELEIVSVKKEDENDHVSDNKYMKEFVKRHFSRVIYHVTKGEAQNELLTYLKTKENALVVLGAYQRGRISRLLQHSTADLLMKNLNLPLFIAHNK